jgi:predicted DCC family thiol-disulfide oxidoreductase YuxK
LFGETDLETRPESFDVEVFYDGDCPLCRREISFLQRRDRQNRIRFTDISSPEFSAERLGKDHETMMAQIHGRLPDGQWIIGVEVFRRLYAAIGWSTPVRLSRLPGVSSVLDWSYRWFAKYRLRLTGRCTDQCRVKVADPGTSSPVAPRPK